MKKLIIITSIIIAFDSCKSKNAIEPVSQVSSNIISLSEIQYQNSGIEIGKMDQRLISSVLKTNGKIDVPPQNMISVSVPLGGYLKFTQLLAGTHVNKGEILAVMEDPQYIQLQQDYLTTKAQLLYSESEYLRQKALNEDKTTSDKIFELAKATFQTQQIQLKSLEQKLKLIGLNPQNVNPETISKNINIYSPITGFVSSVNVNIGKYVTPSDVLFELVNPSDIHLTLTVFEKDVNKLSIGQKLLAYTNTNPEKKYPAEIILISKSLTNDRALEIHCHFEQYDKSLLPGMFMNGEIDIKATAANALPNDAIVRFENKQFVFIQDAEKKFKMIEVQPGNSENGYTELENADNIKNELFVIKGAYNLLMALKNTSDE